MWKDTVESALEYFKEKNRILSFNQRYGHEGPTIFFPDVFSEDTLLKARLIIIEREISQVTEIYRQKITELKNQRDLIIK